MTKVTGVYSNYDASYLQQLANAPLGDHDSNHFVIDVAGYDVVVSGTGITYASGHPSGGTMTGIVITDPSDRVTTWSDMSVSIASAWGDMKSGNVDGFNSLLYGGDDTFTATGNQAYFAGWSGNDTFNMQTTVSADSVSGGDGNDIINYGGNYNSSDQIDGGSGNDVLNLNGDYGSYSPIVVTSVELIKLGAGHNYTELAISPTTATTVDASALGSANSVSLDGLWLNTGSITLLGGAGNDTFLSGKGNDTFNGSDGLDTIDYSHATSGVTVNLALTGAQNVGGGAGTDTLISVENINGSQYDDHLTGNSLDNVFAGNGGKDVIDGGGGNDIVTFQYVPFNGVDSGVTVDLRTGNVDGETLTSVEGIVGSQWGDTFIGNSADNYFDAGGCLNAAYDTVDYEFSSGAMTFTMTSFDGDRTTYVSTGGDQGTDTLVGFSRIIGSSHNDEFLMLNIAIDGGGPAEPFIDGGAGDDTVSFELATKGVTVNLGGTGGESSNFNSVEQLIGSAHSDSLVGDQNSNTIIGGDGDDTISGGGYADTGNDVLDGGDGNDTIDGDGGNDVIYGGNGNDTLYGGVYALEADGNDTIYGGAGDDIIYSAGLDGKNTGNCLLDGGAGDDVLYGDDGFTTASYADATGGVVVNLGIETAQAVGGGAGTDTLVAINGLIGSSFNDVLIGSTGNNTLSGGDGDDVLNGGAGDDVLDGGTGVDTASYAGSTGGVTVSLAITGAQNVGGGAGTDTLISIENLEGSAFDDILTGDGSANTFILTDGGNDAVNGGDGNDTIVAGGTLNASDKIDGGTGTDTLTLAGDYSAGVTFSSTTMVNVEAMTLAGGHTYKLALNDANVALGQTLTVDASALGASNALIFDGSAETDGKFSISGGAGADTITTGAGDDIVTASAGNDVIDVSKGGNDTVSGGDGNDTILVGAALTAKDKIDGGSGIDTLVLNGDYSAGVNFSSSTIVNIETIQLAAGNSYTLKLSDGNVAAGATLTVDASALDSSHSLIFNGSAETDGGFAVTGGNGNDQLTLGAGNDTVNGGGGDDLIDLSKGGNDTAVGGSGNDTFSLVAALTASDKIDGGSGNDTVVLDGDYSGGLVFGATTMINVETLQLSAGHSYNLTTSDATVAAGATLKVNAKALHGSDQLIFNGSAEHDGSFNVIGGKGNDILTGGDGNDQLSGNAGNDILFGGKGADLLFGGHQHDTFAYTAADQSTSTSFDTISHFSAKADSIDLWFTVDAIDAPVTAGSLSLASFDSDLSTALAGLGVHAAIVFDPDSGDFAGKTFLVVDANGVAGYQAGQDLVFELDHASHLNHLKLSAFT